MHKLHVFPTHMPVSFFKTETNQCDDEHKWCVHENRLSFQMSILDAGCGTGNYSLGLLDAGLGRITMMDGSNGMLNTARTKTDHYKDIAEYRLGKLPKLSFPDESFDVVMFNQVRPVCFYLCCLELKVGNVLILQLALCVVVHLIKELVQSETGIRVCLLSC